MRQPAAKDVSVADVKLWNETSWFTYFSENSTSRGLIDCHQGSSPGRFRPQLGDLPLHLQGIGTRIATRQKGGHNVSCCPKHEPRLPYRIPRYFTDSRWWKLHDKVISTGTAIMHAIRIAQNQTNNLEQLQKAIRTSQRWRFLVAAAALHLFFGFLNSIIWSQWRAPHRSGKHLPSL
jgi:hypothetical protein